MILTAQQFDQFCKHSPPQFRELAERAAETLPDGSLKFDSAEFQKILGVVYPERENRNRSFGLGDAVAAIANPIARAIDSVAGTKIEGCGGCAKRRAALNKLVPDL